MLVVIFMPKKETTEPLDEIEVTDSLEVKEITYKYGIPIDKRRVRKYLGRMTRQQMDEIGEAIENALGLYVPEEMEAP